MTTKSARWSLAITGALLIGSLLPACRRQQRDIGPAPAVVAVMNRGVSEMGQYNYDGAVKSFEEVLRSEPSLTEAKINLAIARFNRAQKEQQDVEQSQALLEAVLQADPANARALYFKGIILQHQGQAEAAIPCFEQVLQQRPDDGVAWYILGICKQRAGQDPQKELLRAVALRPYLASAYYRIWQGLQAAGKSAEAAPYLEKFKQLRENPLAETIELPQYNQMGDLALVQPVSAKNVPPITRSILSPQPERVLFSVNDPSLNPRVASNGTQSSASLRLAETRRSETGATTDAAVTATQPDFGGFAAGDLNGDGRGDVILTADGDDGRGRLVCLRTGADGAYTDATSGSGLEQVREPLVCALGDYDNDEIVDLFVGCAASSHLLRGKGDGTFTEVTAPARIVAAGSPVRSAAFLDADHDGDLDLFVGGAGPTGSQLWNNNADGTFSSLAANAGVLAGDAATIAILPGDLDGDRDMDLLLLRDGAPARLLTNELLGKFNAADPGAVIRGDRGGVLQDFNGDGHLDVLTLGGESPELHLHLGDGHGHFHEDGTLAVTARAAGAKGELRAFRTVDLDLDGDLDVVLFAREIHGLLNDGAGRFVFQAALWPGPRTGETAGAEVFDQNGDLVPDLARIERGRTNRLVMVPGELTPPSTALSVSPTGMRSRDKRTRSPASGFGASLLLRAGLHEQRLVHTGLAGGSNQSSLPVVFGLGGARQADYLKVLWPDGVAQVESALAEGQRHKVAELQRKISSCPVLFTWNGSRFEFITDFAGVGGLGYLAAPGEYANPQPLDHVKIGPEQLRARDGSYELRITEAMEETAYVDRLELLAIDHPADWQVYPDERLAVTGAAPTRELLVVEKPIFARRAVNPAGVDCTDQLMRTDRRYAFEPVLDRRFFGFCAPHTLELDFGDQLASRANDRVFLFITGYLEYPYSQTTYAASQAHVGWQPIHIERRMPDGRWQTIVPDAGALGGMARTMTVDLTGLVGGVDCQLRLSTNLEIYYDQIFLGIPVGLDRVKVHALPVSEAELCYAGFAREVSPDGRLPLVYDYQQSEPTAPFDVLSGAYTRYGPVRELLSEFDDQYVLVGPGDEIAAKFDATKLPEVTAGTTRSFVLVSHAYCKDMDLYTATPQTLEPLPFRGMSRYPYPATEHYPDTPEHDRYRATYNTRKIE